MECTTRGGNKFLVDIVPENEFIGKISYIYEHNLKCDIFAKTNIKLFRFEKMYLKSFISNQILLHYFTENVQEEYMNYIKPEW